MHKARYWESEGAALRCNLCPHFCLIQPGRTGRCRVRLNEDGELYAQNYAEVTAIALDPIEKKPLYHFFPGQMILSVGTWGCNLQCQFCQNWEIAHGDPAFVATSAEKLAELAEQQGPLNLGVAYTCSEPIVWLEYVCDAAVAVKRRGLKNVLVTNGFINPEPLAELLPLMDAMNIDLKAFSPGFYQDICGGGLEAVKKTIATAAGSCHVEVTTLVVPGLNDGDEEITQLARWLAGIDPAIPLHLSRYFPRYRMEMPATPMESLLHARSLAQRYLHNVYVGNVG